MHIIRYKWDSLYYLIPKFEPDRTSSSRDIPLFHAFWSQGCKKQQKWLYLWNYSSDSAQILGSSSWDCLACTLWSAFTPKSIPFSRKTGVQLEWQCPTLTSLHCIHWRWIEQWTWRTRLTMDFYPNFNCGLVRAQSVTQSLGGKNVVIYKVLSLWIETHP